MWHLRSLVVAGANIEGSREHSFSQAWAHSTPNLILTNPPLAAEGVRSRTVTRTSRLQGSTPVDRADRFAGRGAPALARVGYSPDAASRIPRVGSPPMPDRAGLPERAGAQARGVRGRRATT